MPGNSSDDLLVTGYRYTDLAGCVDDLKSTLGYIFTSLRRVVSWKSVKQTITVSSIMQHEFLACSKAT